MTHLFMETPSNVSLDANSAFESPPPTAVPETLSTTLCSHSDLAERCSAGWPLCLEALHLLFCGVSGQLQGVVHLGGMVREFSVAPHVRLIAVTRCSPHQAPFQSISCSPLPSLSLPFPLHPL